MSQAARNVREEIEKKRSGRSNGTQLVGVVFLLMVIGTIVWGCWAVISWMNDAQRLPLSRLVVTGERHITTNDDIRQTILSSGEPGTFMSQDVDVLQQQILHLKWIKQASVRKQWPDELKIHIVEYVPYARWNDLQLIDKDGNVFSVPAERVSDKTLPLLYGPEGGEKEVLEGYNSMSQALAAGKFKLKTVAMSERRSWQLVLDNDVRIELGRENRTQRLDRFISLYPILQQQAPADKRIASLDMRYDTGSAVGWAPAFIENQTILSDWVKQQGQAD
ncbi:cell division protein FtsQ [Pragia fontium]|uniref:Cell division protein FtsQ n=2 Tax=Pragia fontium TaxID=82985 RepID=A0AAJ5BFQ0_9GAMM|nr:cell division protein FtsQ [Pragia fontium]AKJ41427.1 cell division protein FtsQ [Pragia fontium]SFB99608.1 cell division protein FtsQ [Pragia fontium DSM 5563 = ATCC 49100]SUB81688.1 Cell division protein FtsQ [Pragia fontium]VEJ54215.1 Cell division protein FtsQ [Pragia fontium]GKX62988.1 cell division protein FtsQ [Pragia fontium]